MRKTIKALTAVMLIAPSLAPATPAVTCNNFYQNIQSSAKAGEAQYITDLRHESVTAKVQYLQQVLAQDPNVYPSIVGKYQDLLSPITGCKGNQVTSDNCKTALLTILASSMEYGSDFPGLYLGQSKPDGVDQEIDQAYFGADSKLRSNLIWQLQLGPQQMITSSKAYSWVDFSKVVDTVAKNEMSQEEINTTLQDAKTYVKKVLMNMPVESWFKDRVAAIIDEVQLNPYPVGCIKKRNSTEEPKEADFDPEFKRVQVCGRYIKKRFPTGALFLVFAHEIAHSFDPCTLAFDQAKTEMKDGRLHIVADTRYMREKLPKIYDYKKNDSLSMYGNLLKCLRSENSVRARPALEYANPPDAASEDPNAPQVVVVRAMRQDPLTYPYLCGLSQFDDLLPRDTITESFADWVSAQAEAERAKDQPNISIAADITGFSQMLARPPKQVIIDDRMGWWTDPHPLTQRRIQNIFLANPTIRAALQCAEDPAKPQPLYCDGSDQHVRYPDFLSDFLPQGQFQFLP